MRGKKILKVLGYAAFVVAALLVSLYLTFPAEAVGQRLEHELRRSTDNAFDVRLAKVSLYRLTGLEAKGVELKSTKQGDTTLVKLDRVRARLQLLPLLLLRPSVSVGADLGDGSLDLQVTRRDDGADLKLELEDLDLTKVQVLASLLGLPLQATAAAELTSAVGIDAAGQGPKQRGRGGLAPERTEGDGKVRLAGVSLGAGTVYGFTVPAPVSLGTLELTLELRKGRLSIASFKQTGGQLAVDLSGAASLRRELASSSLELCVKFKLTDDAYLAQHPKVAAALQLAEVQLKKDGDGFLHLPYGGSLRDPQRQRGLCRSTPKKG